MADPADAYDPEIFPGQWPLPLSGEAVFGRRGPLVVEIGCGGGRFLIRQAELNPASNFLGLERAGEFFRLLKERVAKRRLPNMRVCRNDAADLLGTCLGEASVAVYHLYFPDPWPKKRHRKRRLLSPEFCAHLRRTLAPGGTLYFATDHAGYLEEALPNLRAALDVTEHPGPWEDAPEGRTNYEVKYLKVGRPIWRFVGRKATLKELK